ncbi:polysaccharide biosynthesis tyrosine autokinase [Aggregicoccus sp. 17bor-14]|uniref:polysaccharide biosynthesis tyrosine autokinase n=1 Tax=Myxococcaceae TaxID=31 RepID=UPI00351AAF4F
MSQPGADAPLHAVPRGRAPEPDDDDLDLGQLIGTLYDGRWLIAAAALVLSALGLFYAFTATPVYRADALVQVEEKGAGLDDLKDLTAMFTGEAPAETEVEILRSRSIVATVVDELRLDVIAEPRYFPLVGRAIARHHKQLQLASPVLGLSRFAWGGERIQVKRLKLPKLLEDEKLKLVAGEGGAYELFGPDGELLLKGQVGKLAASSVEQVAGDGSAEVEAFISELVARPGTEFRLVKKPWAEAVEDFQEDLRVSEKTKNTGIIELALEGKSEEQITTALDHVMAVYVKQNVDRKSETAEKTLEFINSQLPLLKSNLDTAEANLNAYRSKRGTVDLNLEAQAIVDQTVESEKQLTALELQRAELRQRFTDSHPALVALKKQIEQLRGQQAKVNDRIKGMPEAELQSVRLLRDVKVANELYLLLQNKAQELNVVKSGTIGNVRVLDHASIQSKPVSPKKVLILAGSLFVGLAFGVALTFLRKALRQGVEDPELLEQTLGISVYASLPHSPRQEELVRAQQRGATDVKPLAVVEPSDLAIESLRSLRTSLQFALAEGDNNTIVIGGPRPGVGKSFVSVNLAHVLADAGRRVLLVDADMRKGLLHRYFGGSRDSGLSELIRGAVNMATAVRSTPTPNVSFLPTGTLPPNPSELLASERFKDLLGRLQADFDVVLIDAPPILAVTDAAILARFAGVNLMVIRSGLHPMRELTAAVSRMEQNGTRPQGFVFNDVPVRPEGYGLGRYGYHYQYEYR